LADTDRDEKDQEPEVSRRDFFGRIGVGACAVAAVGSGAVTLD